MPVLPTPHFSIRNPRRAQSHRLRSQYFFKLRQGRHPRHTLDQNQTVHRRALRPPPVPRLLHKTPKPQPLLRIHSRQVHHKLPEFHLKIQIRQPLLQSRQSQAMLLFRQTRSIKPLTEKPQRFRIKPRQNQPPFRFQHPRRFVQHLRQRGSLMTVRHQQHINRMTLPSHSVRRHQYITGYGNHVFRRSQPFAALLDDGLNTARRKPLQVMRKKLLFPLRRIAADNSPFKPFFHHPALSKCCNPHYNGMMRQTKPP